LLLATAVRLFHVSPEHEIYALQGVNVVLYAGMLTAFGFLLRQIIQGNRHHYGSSDRQAIAQLSACGIIALGYTLVAWAASYWLSLWLVSPDVLVTAFFFLAAAIVLRIRTRLANWRRFVALGFVLGMGYLAKAIMFPLAFIFLTVAALVSGSLRRNVQFIMVGVMTFAVIAAPLAIAISIKAGRPTFGESGRDTYLWEVNGVSLKYWRGDDPKTGTPKHPVRLLSARPRVYEFATPIAGTYPLWYDPAYWYAGATPRFDLKQQISKVEESIEVYLNEFGNSFQPLLLGGLLLLSLSGGFSTGAATLRSFMREWPLWMPSLVGLGLYTAVNVQIRYVAPFLVVLWLAVIAAVRIGGRLRPNGCNVATAVLVAVALIPTVTHTVHDVMHKQIHPEFDSAVQWRSVEAMRSLGIGPGDAIGVIGDGFSAVRWAHLAGVRIIAELPDRRGQEQFLYVNTCAEFWEASPEERKHILALFGEAGAKAVFAGDAPPWSVAAGWHPLGDRNRAAFVFRGSTTAP
jgi:hypothetical protein